MGDINNINTNLYKEIMKLLEEDMYLWHILFTHLYFFQPLVNLRLVWLKLTGDENNQYQEQNFVILGHKDERKEKMWSQNFIKVLTDLERFSERSKKHSKE